MARSSAWVWWLLGGVAAIAALTAGGVAVNNWWMDSQEAKKWAPALAAAEQQYGLPAGLLSRQAYEESGFQPAVIDGTQASSAGALGILQMMPQYFSSVQVPTPFTDADVEAQIQQAAAYDAQLYQQFGDWGLALMAYNWGPGAVSSWLNGGANPANVPGQTSTYANAIIGSLPNVTSAYA